MPSLPAAKLELISSIRAVATCESIVKILDDLTRDPSGKRFTKSRPDRIERWLQLADTATREAHALEQLSATAKTLKRTAKPKPTVTPAPGGFADEIKAMAIGMARAQAGATTVDLAHAGIPTSA